jgi:hypothetical protein
LIDRSITTYIRTFTGRQCWPLNPKPEDICIEDIAHALSNICRFGGHVREFYSVAQHSVLVSRTVPPDLALCGLLHDASEAYLCDIMRPIKPHFPGYAEVEERLMTAIAQVFDFQWPPPPEIKAADMRLLVTERRDLMPDRQCPHTDGKNYEPLSERIEPWLPATASVAFMQRYLEVTHSQRFLNHLAGSVK